jgi:hypothetical protein
MWLAFRRLGGVLAVSVLLGLAFLVWRRPIGPATGPSAGKAAQPPTVEQSRTAEFFRLNEKQPSDPELASEYQSINLQYFEGRLPSIVIRWEPRLAEIGPLIAEDFRLEGITNGRVILLNPAIEDNDELFRRTLVHEIVHVATHEQDKGHGPVFQSRLRRLSEQGAFVGKVATEEEKQELHRAIETGQSDLHKAEAALRQTREQLDADTARVQALPDDPARNAAVADLQSRIDFYNADTQRFNADVARLNRMVEDYNLMIAYPDGLDRERMAQRTVAGPR